MSKTTIYYFSATGNSLAVARDLAKVLDVGEPISVPGSLINKNPYIDTKDAKAVGFVFPVQRATIPEMLRGFIQSMPIDPNCYYFAVSTYSLLGSNEFWDIDELLSEKGAELNYAMGIRMMGNVGVSEPSKTTIERRLQHMDRCIDEIASAVAYRQENYFPRASKLLGKAVRAYTNSRRKRISFRIDKRCKKCGICAQVCPAQNILLPTKDSDSPATGPIRSDKCEACLACVHWCPAAAISTSKRKHVRYHNPRVQPEELHSQFPAGSEEGLASTLDETLASRKNDSGTSIQPDAELAAALRDDLVTPADIDTWLGEVESQQASKTRSRHAAQNVIPASQQTMSTEDIARAVADLES